jgi:hypothetical protein
VACLIARDQPLSLGETREGKALILARREVLGGARDDSLSHQVVDNDCGEELVFIGIRREPTDIVLQTVVERCRDMVHVLVRDSPNCFDPTPDSEHLFVDTEYGLQVSVLVCDLSRQQELDLIVGRGQKEWGKEAGDVELGMEAMRKDPDETVLLAGFEGNEAGTIPHKVEPER